MRFTTLLAGSFAALACASPVQSSVEASSNQTFHVDKFVFGCTVTCDWYFDVTISDGGKDSPAVKKPIHCQGNTKITNFSQAAKTCGKISSTQSLIAFIGKNNNLRLKYEVDEPKAGATYWYEGKNHVNAATSGKPQSATFDVPVSKASAVA